jgi:hypothetical protein
MRQAGDTVQYLLRQDPFTALGLRFSRHSKKRRDQRRLIRHTTTKSPREGRANQGTQQRLMDRNG